MNKTSYLKLMTFSKNAKLNLKAQDYMHALPAAMALGGMLGGNWLFDKVSPKEPQKPNTWGRQIARTATGLTGAITLATLAALLHSSTRNQEQV